ncbi:hypothetical protein A5893_02515 [Pedobacter psychrophilus]|uniref:Uncharacterized protein n=1 Tax=Pedobacter psychrophilus TaxID=1826909 RepID=A0A179DMQ8_9SPHI|nr:hypothetical protein [Pedobacter psychrophilus]OAQ42010.1 hypothetical protein A5893_02515 [Pedobacter psychrophilus]
MKKRRKFYPVFFILIVLTVACKKSDKINQDTAVQEGKQAIVNAVTTVPKGATTLFFKSSFQANTSIQARVGTKSKLIGTDNGYTWNGNVTNGFEGIPYLFSQSINFNDTNTANGSAAILNDPTGGTNTTNKVLRFEIVNAAENDAGSVATGGKKGRVQLDCQVSGTKFKEYYQEVKLLVPAGFNALANTNNPFYMTMFEYFDDLDNNYAPDIGSFRISINLIKANGGLSFAVQGQNCVVDNTWRTAYTYTATSKIPINQWFTIKLFIKQAIGSDLNGNIQLALNDSIVINCNNQISSALQRNNGYESIYPLKLYASKTAVDAVKNSGNQFKIYWDDFLLQLTKR